MKVTGISLILVLKVEFVCCGILRIFTFYTVSNRLTRFMKDKIKSSWYVVGPRSRYFDS